MNSLSWLLYFIDLVSNLRGLFICLSLIAGFSLLCCIFGWIIDEQGLYPYWVRHLIFTLVVAVITSLIPSKNTMYAIAASQMGERAMQSDMGQELLTDGQKAVRVWIKKQLEDK